MSERTTEQLGCPQCNPEIRKLRRALQMIANGMVCPEAFPDVHRLAAKSAMLIAMAALEPKAEFKVKNERCQRTADSMVAEGFAFFRWRIGREADYYYGWCTCEACGRMWLESWQAGWR